MNLELIESEGASALQDCIQMLQEPAPCFSRGNALGGSRVGSDSFFNGGEMRNVTDGEMMLGLDILSIGTGTERQR
jgi:hypothetical protein